MSFLLKKLLRQSRDSASLPVATTMAATAARLTPNELIDLAVAESAQSDLAKRSKLGVAFDALMLGHFGQIAEDEVKSVAAYREKHNERLGSSAAVAAGGDVPPKDMNIIVCDNINEKQDALPHPAPQPKQPILPWVLSAALGAAGLTAGVAWLLSDGKDDDKPPVVVTQPAGDALSGVGSTTQLIQGK